MEVSLADLHNIFLEKTLVLRKEESKGCATEMPALVPQMNRTGRLSVDCWIEEDNVLNYITSELLTRLGSMRFML